MPYTFGTPEYYAWAKKGEDDYRDLNNFDILESISIDHEITDLQSMEIFLDRLKKSAFSYFEQFDQEWE